MNTTSIDLSEVRRWLLQANFAPILEIARSKKHILSLLTALTFDPDPEVSARSISASGLVAQIIADRDPKYVRNYLLRLFWLLNDESGGICWRAPELIGEILYYCPGFEQFFSMLISLLNLEIEDRPRFLTGTLWAIGRVAQTKRLAMLPAILKVQACLQTIDEQPAREMAAWCMQQLASVDR